MKTGVDLAGFPWRLVPDDSDSRGAGPVYESAHPFTSATSWCDLANRAEEDWKTSRLTKHLQPPFVLLDPQHGASGAVTGAMATETVFRHGRGLRLAVAQRRAVRFRAGRDRSAELESLITFLPKRLAHQDQRRSGSSQAAKSPKHARWGDPAAPGTLEQ